MSRTFIALGSNEQFGGRASDHIVRSAIKTLATKPLENMKVSRLYRSPAFPAGAGPDYVNAVIEVETALDPLQILDLLDVTEASFGRTRGARWASRTLDLDLLAVGGNVLPDRETYDLWRGMTLEAQAVRHPETLILPHPRMQDRAFVLVPLAEIAPGWRHPVLHRTAAEMRDALAEHDLAQVTPLPDA